MCCSHRNFVVDYFLIDAQDLRNTGDYGKLNAVSINQANEQILNAENFLKTAENLIGTLPEN